MLRDVEAGIVDRLDRAIAGRVIGPDAPDFDDARRTFNALIDRRPAAIARPTTPDDVARVIGITRDVGLPLGVRGGGHSVAGHAIVEGGVVIDLSDLRGVLIDPDRRIAHVQGGAQWQDLDAPALEHGLAVPGGVYGDTGVGGLTLGGGIGFLMGIGGFTCDNLVGAQVVTASGDVVEAANDPDLLWALRGGGGNFGVVTRFDLGLHPIGTMYGGKAEVPLGDGSVLRRWATQMREAPDTLLPMIIIYPAEDGTPTAQVQFAYAGPESEGATFASELLGEPTKRHPGLRAGTYLDIQAMNPIESFGRRNYWTSTFVRDLDDELVDLLVEVAQTFPTPVSGLLLEPLHGLARRIDPNHAAFQNRTARFHVSAIAIWEDPALDAIGTAWSKNVTARVSAWSSGGLYVNYSMPGEAASTTAVDRARAAYPPAVYERLRGVKRRYDPGNLFRSNLNIVPAEG